MQGASLDRAELQGALLNRVQLQGASLDRAQLQRASLYGAQLQGAILDQAQLQGASLEGARLQGARLIDARMQGAWLARAQLQGASLNRAQMQGAWLAEAELQGAMLEWAQMQGAWLAEAQLQGALLEGAQMQGALALGAKVWRMRALNSALDDAQLPDLDFSDAPPCLSRFLVNGSCAQRGTWAAWIETWTKSILNTEWLHPFRERLAILTANNQPAGAETAQSTWRNHPPPPPEAVAKRLGDLACGPDHAPHIARGIWRQILREQPRNLGTQRQTLAARMLSDDCPGAKDLAEDLRSRLRDITAGRE